MPNLIQQRVEECFNIAESYFQRTFRRPDISFQLRGQKAGVAHIDENRLRFNPTLYTENREHFLEHTVAHEVAHLVAYAVYGKKNSSPRPTMARGNAACLCVACSPLPLLRSA